MQTVLLIGKCYSFVVYVVNDDYKNVNALHELPKKKNQSIEKELWFLAICEIEQKRSNF